MVLANGTNMYRVFTSVCGEGASLSLRLQLDDISPLYGLIFDCCHYLLWNWLSGFLREKGHS